MQSIVSYMTGCSCLRETDLLYHPTPIHLQSQRQNIAGHGDDHKVLLRNRSMFKEFLNHLRNPKRSGCDVIDVVRCTHIVSKDVVHQVQGVVGHNLVEHLLLLIGSRRLELLLDESGPMLIPAELDDLSDNVLEYCVNERRESQSRSKYGPEGASSRPCPTGTVPTARSSSLHPSRQTRTCLAHHHDASSSASSDSGRSLKVGWRPGPVQEQLANTQRCEQTASRA